MRIYRLFGFEGGNVREPGTTSGGLATRYCLNRRERFQRVGYWARGKSQIRGQAEEKRCRERTHRNSMSDIFTTYVRSGYR